MRKFFENITIIIPIIRAIRAIIEYNRNAPEILKAVEDLKKIFAELENREKEVADFKEIMSDD